MRRVALWLMALGACAELPELDRAVCGNAVLEDGEDCDSAESSETSRCVPPGEEGACRFDCSVEDGRAWQCPPGLACGFDRLCRRPTGAYEAIVRHAVGDVASLAVGDFDGDERADLLSRNARDSSSRFSLGFHYFDARAALVDSRRYRNLVLSHAIGRVSADALDDVVFSDYRVGVLLGQPDHSWVPEAFTPYVVPDGLVRLTGLHEGSVEGVAPLVTLRSLGDAGPGLSTPDITSGTVALRASIASPLEDLLGDPLAMDVAEGPSSPCAELVLAFRGETLLRQFDLCGPEGADGIIPWSKQARTVEVALDPPAPLEAPPISGDLDGDGHLDLVVRAGGITYAALGDGRALSVARPYQPVPDPLLNDETPPSALGTPLAVADLSGDGAADFVFPNHIVLSTIPPGPSRPRYAVVWANSNGRWDVARVADLNGNGHLDVAAAQRGQMHVDYFNGSGNPWLLGSRISTVRPVSHLATGDFDGDLIGDLAMVEQAPSASERDTVKVAWGAYAQVPGAAQTVARVRAVHQVGAFREAGTHSLLVVSEHPSPSDPRDMAYLFGGNAERTPFAALQLSQFAEDGTIGNFIATTLVLGAFVGGAAKDALVLAAEQEQGRWEFWLVPAVDSALPTALRLAGALDPRLSPSSARPNLPIAFPAVTVYAAGAAADLDRDGRDESIWVMPADQGARCGIETFRMTGTTQDRTLTSGGLVVLDAPCEEPQLAALHADDDGMLDLVVLTGRRGASDRKLFVLWNDGTGRFAVERSTLVNGNADSPEAFTVLPKTSGAPLSLVYATSQAVVQWRYAGGRAFGASTKLADLRRGTGIVAGDFDGDRVIDLAVADDGDIGVLRAQVR